MDDCESKNELGMRVI